MTPPDPIDPLASQLRTDVTPERELGLRSALRRNKEQLFETLDAPARASRHRSPYAMGALLATALAAGAAWIHGRPVSVAAPSAVLTAIDVAQPSGPAAFDRHPSQSGERVALNAGTLAFRTHGGGPKLRVVVPDGELEDVGTAFRVTVADGRTTSIEVTEGLVVFHRHDAEDVRLPAGTTWQPGPAVAAFAPGPHLPAPMPSAPAHTAASLGTPARPVPSAAAETGEDAAYLRIVALIRENRRAEARVASQEYLRRYPSGFRRVEVEQLAR